MEVSTLVFDRFRFHVVLIIPYDGDREWENDIEMIIDEPIDCIIDLNWSLVICFIAAEGG